MVICVKFVTSDKFSILIQHRWNACNKPVRWLRHKSYWKNILLSDKSRKRMSWVLQPIIEKLHGILMCLYLAHLFVILSILLSWCTSIRSIMYAMVSEREKILLKHILWVIKRILKKYVILSDRQKSLSKALLSHVKV